MFKVGLLRDVLLVGSHREDVVQGAGEEGASLVAIVEIGVGHRPEEGFITVHRQVLVVQVYVEVVAIP